MSPVDDFSYRALALAEAEVGLAMAEQALTEFEAAARELSQSRAGATAQAFEVVGNALAAQSEPAQFQLALHYLRRIAEQDKEQRKQGRLLKRYLSEAKSKRRKAFAAWIEVRAQGAELA